LQRLIKVPVITAAVAVAIVAGAGVASAAHPYNASTGGYSDKADVQYTLEWNDSTVQAGTPVAFELRSVTTTTKSWACTNDETYSRLRIASSVAPVPSTPDINQRGKILGWDLDAAGPSVDTVTGSGPDLNTCPIGVEVVPRSNTSTVETVSGLYVNGKLLQTRPVAPTV
jgi:hypothetical protein